MRTITANTTVLPGPQSGHRVNVRADDEGLDHRAGLLIIASVSDAIGNHDNGRTV
jgi:hypothetical protein